MHISVKLKEIMLKGRSFSVAKGQIIQSTDDRRVFNYIDSGYVKRYLISNDGNLGTQVVYGPGEVFPITFVFDALLHQTVSDSPEIYYYEAMTKVDLHMLNEADLVDVVKSDPGLYKDLMMVAGMRLQSTLHGLENLTLKNSYYRVAHELLFLANKFGIQKDKVVKIPLPLTHQDLADILSLTRETVSVAMAQLTKNGLIRGGKTIVVKDIDKLRDEAYS
jgi:CRP-like cAMP-binding protein